MEVTNLILFLSTGQDPVERQAAIGRKLSQRGAGAAEASARGANPGISLETGLIRFLSDMCALRLKTGKFQILIEVCTADIKNLSNIS